MKLVIRHLSNENEPDVFRVENQGNMKTADFVMLPDPHSLIVEGRPNSSLLQDLRWYLEDFLSYPFSPNTEIAERVQRALKEWGETVFSKLFANKGRDWYQDARRDGLEKLTVSIASDEPRILAWPWEALRDPEGSILANSCCIERQLNDLHDPLPLSQDLPRNSINILLVIARPFGDADVGYHALSRPLVELSQQKGFPVTIDVLRPPTFEMLREKLKSQKDHYHIIHFDGHGGYGEVGHSGTSYMLKGPTGHLCFETIDGKNETVTAEQLTQLLTEYRIPVMVLNACQSARIDERAEDPFASVAAALQKAGIRSVVAMGYSLYVSGAQQFVLAFYKRLFSSGSVAEATRAGRQAMLAAPKRACVRGEFELQDWLVPVVYGQEPLPLTFAEKGTAKVSSTDDERIELPSEATELGDYGFIGRERAVLTLERALRLQPQAGLLIHGMAGIGKTTLVKGFLKWLSETNGLHYTPIWFSFDEIHSTEFVVNRLISAFFDTNALAAPMEQKIEALINVLSENPVLIVWDNFESAAGIDGTEVTVQLPEDDRQLLARLLHDLRGGKTKVLITSRSPERWLTLQSCFRLSLGGLQGEECWEYCNTVVRDLGLTIDRNESAYAEIMEQLDGHPLAIRAILLRLAEKDAESLKKDLKEGFAGAEGDESTCLINAALHVLVKSFPSEFDTTLQFVGLHQCYVVIDHVEEMSETSDVFISTHTLNATFTALENAGQIHSVGNGVYSMHPALSCFLRRKFVVSDTILLTFVEFMGDYANCLTPKEQHEQREPFAVYGSNFKYALTLARQLHYKQYITALIQSLASYYENNRVFSIAERLFHELAEYCLLYEDYHGEAAAYHHLGIIAQGRRDFVLAKQWHYKSLAICEKEGYEHYVSLCYHQLGLIAQECRDFVSAKEWYEKSLEIKESEGYLYGAANTYHNLGVIAEAQGDYISAKEWHYKSLEIKENDGNSDGAANSYHHLGIIALEQDDFVSAKEWHYKSLEIFEEEGNTHGMSSGYHALGMIAEAQDDYISAKEWYYKSLEIKENDENSDGAASTYHHLGIIALEQGDFVSAKEWHHKSLAIFMKEENTHGVAGGYHELGRIAEAQGELATAKEWHYKSLTIFENEGNAHGVSLSYHQLGLLSIKQKDYDLASNLLIHAACGFVKRPDQHALMQAVNNYIHLLQQVPDYRRTEFITSWNNNNLPVMPSWEELKEIIDENE